MTQRRCRSSLPLQRAQPARQSALIGMPACAAHRPLGCSLRLILRGMITASPACEHLSSENPLAVRDGLLIQQSIL